MVTLVSNLSHFLDHGEAGSQRSFGLVGGTLTQPANALDMTPSRSARRISLF